MNTEPTEAQKKAGNYKKGHVQVGTFDITIEQPEGSIRRGTDADGKQWESKMHNTYGYFRGTEGVDGDHIDVFLSNDIDGWNGRKVFVVDQYNPDGTFDEHKVMLGFNDMDEAKSDYLANYEKGWENGRRITVSTTNLEDFEKWIDSSHRKTKPFSEYSSVNKGSEKAEKKQKKQSVFDKAKEIADKEEKKRKAEAEDDSVLGQATRAVGKKKKVNLFKYTASEKNSYPTLRGVHYANGYAYASDGYILFKEKADYPKEWEGTTRDKDGNLVDGKYPDAEKAIHRLVHIPDKEVESLPSKGVLDFAIAAGKKSKVEAIPVAVDGIFFNAVALKKFLEAVASKGMDRVVYRHPMLYATNGKDEIVMMPTVNTLEGALDIADRMERAGLPKEQIDAWKAHIEAADKKKSFDDFKKAVENAKKEGVRPTEQKKKSVRPTEAERPKQKELTEAERELRDNLVERMRKGGLDVVTDSEEMQRVIDTENERTRNKRSKKSEAARKRDEALYAVDWSTAFVSGKSREEAAEIRRERGRKFKEETKELYGRVLSGNFDDVTLRLIDKFVDKSTPNNPYERPISKRLPARALQKMRGGERTGSIDALFSRISESAVGKDGKALPRAERERAIEEKKKELLKKWAIATGNWHTDIADFTDQREPIGSGTDSDVYLGKDGKSVIKVSKGKPYGKRFRPDVDNVALFNTVFPGSRYTIEGYGEVDGKFVRFLKQPIVDFTSSTPLTEGERVAYMEKLGFKPINKENTAFSNGEIIASDLQKSNIVKDKQGNVRVIDADMKLHTKDVGGNYSYPDVEADTRTDGMQRFLRTAGGEVYGLVKDGRIYLDPKVATSETAVHEYTHLWGDMLRRKDSEQWSHTVKELKNSVLWEEVKELYPELKTDDEIADEVLSTFSGRRGAERLREEARRVADGDGGVFTKAKAIETLERVKEAIARFWEGVARMFGINRYRSTEELADMAMRDLINGVKPTSRTFTFDNFYKDTKAVFEGTERPKGKPDYTSYSGSEYWYGEDKGGKYVVRGSDHWSGEFKVKDGERTNVGRNHYSEITEDGMLPIGAQGSLKFGWEKGLSKPVGSGISAAIDRRGSGDSNNIASCYWYIDNAKEKDNKGFTYGKAYLSEFEDKERRRDIPGDDWRDIQGVEGNTRNMFVGERGATEADKAEEVSTRLDNLSVARRMEEAKKDAKYAKMDAEVEEASGVAVDEEDGELYRDGELERINEEFNNRLSSLAANRNQKDRVLKLGRPSRFLIDGGVTDAEIILEFDKLARKSDEGYKNEHPFDVMDVENLPLAIAYPIAVFDNTNGYSSGKVILTELEKDGRNFIVVVQTISQRRKGGVVLEVNRIDTLFPKEERGIVNWFNKGLASNIDKEKALRFIKALPNHPGTITKEELLSATKKVKNFENSKSSDVDRLVGALKDKTDFELYNRLAGEVEARNTEKRIGMTKEERRASLASETEDVAREDQILLRQGLDGIDIMRSEAAATPLKGDEALTALDSIFGENEGSAIPPKISSFAKFKNLFRKPVRTFLGELVQVKDEVWNKILRNNRQDITGTVLPTIESADFAIRDTDGSTLYVKRFKGDGQERMYNVVVVNKHGEVEDYISSVHIKRDNNLRNKIKEGAELFLPNARTTDGTMSRNNSTPGAKVANYSETAKPRYSRKPGESIFDYASRVSEDVDRSVRERVSARDEYEKKVKSKGFQTKEALQNSMLGLQEFMYAIDHASGNKRYIEDIPDFENPILGENRLSSVNKEESHSRLDAVHSPTPTKGVRKPYLRSYTMIYMPIPSNVSGS